VKTTRGSSSRVFGLRDNTTSSGGHGGGALLLLPALSLAWHDPHELLRQSYIGFFLLHGQKVRKVLLPGTHAHGMRIRFLTRDLSSFVRRTTRADPRFRTTRPRDPGYPRADRRGRRTRIRAGRSRSTSRVPDRQSSAVHSSTH
jgi:hypothetical protein